MYVCRYTNCVNGSALIQTHMGNMITALYLFGQHIHRMWVDPSKVLSVQRLYIFIFWNFKSKIHLVSQFCLYFHASFHFLLILHLLSRFPFLVVCIYYLHSLSSEDYHCSITSDTGYRQLLVLSYFIRNILPRLHRLNSCPK